MSERRNKQRREVWSERRSDRLSPALKKLSREEVEGSLAVRDARIEIRCPSTVKDEIEAIANRYGLTITTYFLHLHELAESKLGEK